MFAKAIAAVRPETACTRHGGEDQCVCGGGCKSNIEKFFQTKSTNSCSRNNRPEHIANYSMRRVTNPVNFSLQYLSTYLGLTGGLSVNNHLLCLGRRNAAAGGPLRSPRKAAKQPLSTGSCDLDKMTERLHKSCNWKPIQFIKNKRNQFMTIETLYQNRRLLGHY